MSPTEILALPYHVFLSTLLNLSEEDCWQLLLAEKNGSNRHTYVQRIYGRANKLRSARERKEWTIQ